MDATPSLIPTRYKGPLAKATSYPVGAELLSRELSEVPQYEALDIGFYGEKNQAFLLSKRSFPVLMFEYKKIQGGYSTSNCDWSQSRLEPNWKITVYPVLSINRRMFREYLALSGWSLIRTWLNDEWSINGRIGAASLVIAACHTTNEFRHETKSEVMPKQ